MKGYFNFQFKRFISSSTSHNGDGIIRVWDLKRHDTNTFISALDLSQEVRPNRSLLVAAEVAFFAVAAEVSFFACSGRSGCQKFEGKTRGHDEGSVHDGATIPEAPFLLGKGLEQTIAQRWSRDGAKGNRS